MNDLTQSAFSSSLLLLSTPSSSVQPPPLITLIYNSVVVPTNATATTLSLLNATAAAFQQPPPQNQHHNRSTASSFDTFTEHDLAACVALSLLSFFASVVVGTTAISDGVVLQITWGILQTFVPFASVESSLGDDGLRMITLFIYVRMVVVTPYLLWKYWTRPSNYEKGGGGDKKEKKIKHHEKRQKQHERFGNKNSVANANGRAAEGAMKPIETKMATSSPSTPSQIKPSTTAASSSTTSAAASSGPDNRPAAIINNIETENNSTAATDNDNNNNNGKKGALSEKTTTGAVKPSTEAERAAQHAAALFFAPDNSNNDKINGFIPDRIGDKLSEMAAAAAARKIVDGDDDAFRNKNNRAGNEEDDEDDHTISFTIFWLIIFPSVLWTIIGINIMDSADSTTESFIYNYIGWVYIVFAFLQMALKFAKESISATINRKGKRHWDGDDPPPSPWLMRLLFPNFIKTQKGGVSPNQKQFLSGDKITPHGKFAIFLASSISGFLTTFSGIGTPPMMLLILLYEIPIGMMRYTFPMAAVITSWVRLFYAIMRGIIPFGELWMFFLPASITGVFGMAVGVKIGNILTPSTYNASVIALLLIAGTVMMSQSPYLIVPVLIFTCVALTLKYFLVDGRSHNAGGEDNDIAAFKRNRRRRPVVIVSIGNVTASFTGGGTSLQSQLHHHGGRGGGKCNRGGLVDAFADFDSTNRNIYGPNGEELQPTTPQHQPQQQLQKTNSNSASTFVSIADAGRCDRLGESRPQLQPEGEGARVENSDSDSGGGEGKSKRCESGDAKSAAVNHRDSDSGSISSNSAALTATTTVASSQPPSLPLHHHPLRTLSPSSSASAAAAQNNNNNNTANNNINMMLRISSVSGAQIASVSGSITPQSARSMQQAHRLQGSYYIEDLNHRNHSNFDLSEAIEILSM